MSNPTTPTTATLNALATFQLDVKYTRIAEAFTAAGIRTILLKGPAFDQLLFGGARSRTYSDIDLLVDPGYLPAADQLLEHSGFRRADRESGMNQLMRRGAIAVGALSSAHATAWIRDGDRFVLDVHHTLPHIGAPPASAWRALSAHRVRIMVVDTPAETLDRPASAFVIAVHAAHHGPGWNRARSDLRRACEVLERDCWHAAAQLARELRAEAAMGIGLGTVSEGCALARELGLATRPSLANRLMWSGIAWRERRRAATS
jgi:hypothetical protein